VGEEVTPGGGCDLGAATRRRWSFDGFIVSLMGCEPGPVFHELQPSDRNKEPGLVVQQPNHPINRD
jgi:hypothetical protein